MVAAEPGVEDVGERPIVELDPSHTTPAGPDLVRALVDAETWLENTVIEKSDLIERSKRDGDIIHMGDLMSICSVKHAEGPEHAQVYKGRVFSRR